MAKQSVTRHEYQWLVHTRPWLQPGGLLVWVVPQHMLRFRKATRYILSWYDRVQIFRFPDEEYERFKQIVLFGVHRPKAVAPDGEMVEKLAQLALGKEMLPLLTDPSACPTPLGRSGQAEPTYTLPPLAVKQSAFKFRSHFVDSADALVDVNIGLRQANTIIGEYSLVDDDEDETVEAAVSGNGHMRRDDQRPLLIPDHLTVANGAVHNGRSAHQVSLFANGHGQAQTNGIAASPSPNGQTPDQEQSSEADKPAVITPAFTPPTLRPRLLI